MKKNLFLLVAMMLISSVSFAQTIKFGTVDTQAIIMLLPETDSAELKLKAYEKTLMADMQTMQSDLQKKVDDITKNAGKYSDAMRQQKEREFKEGQQALQDFQRMAQEDFTSKQAEYLKPSIDMTNAAIKKVCDSNGITFCINKLQSPFVYTNESNVTDITAQVKAELGLK